MQSLKKLEQILADDEKLFQQENKNRYRSVLQDEHAEITEYEFSKSRKLTKGQKRTELAGRKLGLNSDGHYESATVDFSKNKVNFEHAIPSNSKVIVTRMNHLVEIQHMKTMNFKQTIKMLPRNEDTGFREYEVVRTGEIHNMQESENRSENKNSLGQTFKKLRYLINNNFTGGGNELHITLTFRENVTDSKELYKIFDKFIKRMKYRCKKINQKLEYINVIEPHASGRWHCHVLMSFTELIDGEYVPLLKDVYIPPKELEDIWGQGFVTIKKLKNVDNIGAYLSAYLADVDVTGEDITGENVVTKNVDGVEKKFLKGGRLHFYDSGTNLYRSSKGIIAPEREHMKYKDIKKEVGHQEPHFSQRINIESEDYKNEITYLQYNLKRK